MEVVLVVVAAAVGTSAQTSGYIAAAVEVVAVAVGEVEGAFAVAASAEEEDIHQGQCSVEEGELAVDTAELVPYVVVAAAAWAGAVAAAVHLAVVPATAT